MKEYLGGNGEAVDLSKYEEKYDNVVASFKQQLSSIRVGRLEPASLNMIDVKVGAQSFPLNAVAQVTAKGANICVVSPFDSSQIDIVEKAIRNSDDTLEIKRQENSLSITQLAQRKDARDKLVQKVKKLSLDRKEELKKLRSNTQ